MCCELNAWLWMPWLAYVPDHMAVLMADLSGEPTPAETIRLETDPARVEAVDAYRQGDLQQADFFAAMGAG